MEVSSQESVQVLGEVICVLTYCSLLLTAMSIFYSLNTVSECSGGKFNGPSLKYFLKENVLKAWLQENVLKAWLQDKEEIGFSYAPAKELAKFDFV